MTTAVRQITLTAREVEAEADFHERLSEGASIRAAAFAVRTVYRRSCRAVFYRWLLTGNAT